MELLREDGSIKKAIAPMAEVFNYHPKKLPKLAKRFEGKTLSLGDASTEIPALKGMSLAYILYSFDKFPASANILFDQ